MDPVRLRILLMALCSLLALANPVWAQQPGHQASTRQPHMFYEPQAKYPPLGAMQAFREGLPMAIGSALVSLVLAMWLTRPLPEVERALYERQARSSQPDPPKAPPPPGPPEQDAVDLAEPPGKAATPEAEEEPVSGPGPESPLLKEVSGPADLPVLDSPETLPSVLRPAALEPSLPRPEALRPVERLPQARPLVPALPAGTSGFTRGIRPPLETPLVPFAWEQVAPENMLPFREGEFCNPGLVVYLVDPERVAGVLAALAVELLLESPGGLVLATVSAGPLEVVQFLLEAGPAIPPAELLARLRREGRAMERIVRRVWTPPPGGMPLEDLLRRARELREGRGGLAGVVLEPLTRLELGGGELSAWLERLHQGAALAGFPLFMVASRRGFPIESCPGRILTLGEAEVSRITESRGPGKDSPGPSLAS